jgi:mRNA degradation ribonuclease J1/J2
MKNDRYMRQPQYVGSYPQGEDTLRLVALGGSGNVTKNMYVYEYRQKGRIRDILIVDCGIGFPDPGRFGDSGHIISV